MKGQMMAMKSLDPIRCAALLAALIAAPALAQSTQERGVFVAQVGDGNRADIAQQNSDSLARVVQNGNDNELGLTQNGSAPHRAQIGQDGDGNHVTAAQDGDGSTELTLVQDGDGNTASVLQRETSLAERTGADILQRGNGNTIVLIQNGSDNSASLAQQGDDNVMTANQLDSGNRLAWSQIGDNLTDLRIEQQGGANLEITQSNTGAQFAPPPGSGG
jgi:hypothetical protein